MRSIWITLGHVMLVCILHTEYELQTYTWNGSLSHNFYITVLQFYAHQPYVLLNLNILIISSEGDVIPRLACWACIPLFRKLPEDGSLVLKHARF
jgi:hypothetical protein